MPVSASRNLPPVARELHQYDLTDRTADSQPRLAVEHGLHQLGRRDLPLDNGLCPAAAHQRHCSLRNFASLNVLDRELVHVNLITFGSRADLRLWPDQDRLHPAAIIGDPHGFEDCRISRTCHGHAYPRHALVGIVKESLETVERHRRVFRASHHAPRDD